MRQRGHCPRASGAVSPGTTAADARRRRRACRPCSRQSRELRLVRNAILDLQDDRFPWIFGTRRYSLVDAGVERELKQRIGTVLSSDVIPDPRDIVIITLAGGCGLLGHLLSADELARAGPPAHGQTLR